MKLYKENTARLVTHIELPDGIFAENVFVTLATNEQSFVLTDHAQGMTPAS